jgi:hypothetical protein
MIYYPLSVLMLAGIKEVLIITTPQDQPSFINLLGDGSELGMRFEYVVQPTPDGLAQAFILGEEFLDGDDACLVLDEKTGDIARAFPALAGISDYSNFNKNPRRIVDDLHFFVQERGKVIAATPDDISKDPLNKHVLGMNDWIITLPSFTIDSGSYMFEDAPEIKSMVYRYLADLDISSTYPNAEDVLNISKETTAYETCKFNGFTEAEQRYFSLTLTTGKSSALELGVRYLNMPSPQQLLEQFDKDHAIESTVKEVTTIEEVI